MANLYQNHSVTAKYVPVICWLVVVLSLLFIPLRIASYGYIPVSDAHRHVAHAFTARPYQDLIVMDPLYKVNHSPGWELLLRQLHLRFGLGKDALVSFSIIFGFLAVLWAPLLLVRYPESWLAALLLILAADTGYFYRLSQGRPFLVTEGLLIFLMLIWSRRRFPLGRMCVLTTAGAAVSTYVHGNWYMWAVPVLAIGCTGRWRDAVCFATAISGGILLGAVFTGHPFTFLNQALEVLRRVSGEQTDPSQLVTELLPSTGEPVLILFLATMLTWCCMRGSIATPLYRDPLFCGFVICWILGLTASRFLADWGTPMAAAWLLLRWEDLIAASWSRLDWRRAGAAVALAAPVYFAGTSNWHDVYTRPSDVPYLDASAPNLQEWFPEGNGLLYSDQPKVFYQTFYQNPEGPWRYVVGMEAAIMRDDDLAVYRDISRKHTPDAYAPWVKKMKTADRLLIRSRTVPAIAELEWKEVSPGWWMGRKPRS